MCALLELIEMIPGPRQSGKIKYNLSSLLFRALYGVLSGCESWQDISDYCAATSLWLSDYIDLRTGMAFSDTYRRLFTRLDPNSIESLLRLHAFSLINDGKCSDQILYIMSSLKIYKMSPIGQVKR